MFDIRKIQSSFANRRKWRLHEVPNAWLAVIGSATFLCSAYWWMKVAEIAPGLVRAIDQHGVNLDKALALALIGGLAIKAWALRRFAYQCNKVLQQRMFS